MLNIIFLDNSNDTYFKNISINEIANLINTNISKLFIGIKTIQYKNNFNLVFTNFKLKNNLKKYFNIKKYVYINKFSINIYLNLISKSIKLIFKESQIINIHSGRYDFYCDLLYKKYFSKLDILKIEKKFSNIIKNNKNINFEAWKIERCISFFKNYKEFFRLKILKFINKIFNYVIYLGDFVDIFIEHNINFDKKVKIFKLIKTSKINWIEKNSTTYLQRIFFTYLNKRQYQNKYIYNYVRIKNTDHRKIGKNLDLFKFNIDSPGLVYWNNKGLSILNQIKKYMRLIYHLNGYKEIKTPQILNISCWKETGHWENYRDNMFKIVSEDINYALKPMNCPCHVKIYNFDIKSYKDLPLRYGEFGQCHRKEYSGSLHGLMRLNGFTQDDGHIFCTEKQLQNECLKFTLLLQKVYNDFGFKNIIYKIALRPFKRIGTEIMWDKSEKILINSLNKNNCKFEIIKGEGAFYGPKIEYTLNDSNKREWQCGTLQIDFSTPNMLNVKYIDKKNIKLTPVILHRAILGSFERFIGVLIENYYGKLPTWISPIQIIICCISRYFYEYSLKIKTKLLSNSLRVEVDLRKDKINRKIMDSILNKIPYLIIIGTEEINTKTLSIKILYGLDLNLIYLNEFTYLVKKDIKNLNINPNFFSYINK